MVPMKIVYSIVFYCLLTATASAQKQNWESQDILASKRVKLPNGWQLSPAGRSFPLGDLPLNMAVSPTKKLIAVTNNGQSIQSIQLIDAKSEKVISSAI